MAKAYGVIVGLCCLFSLLIGNCNSFETKSTDHFIYDTLTPHGKTDANTVYQLYLRSKRQTSKEAAITQKKDSPSPGATITQTDVANAAIAQNDTQTKPPDTDGGGGAGGGGGVNAAIKNVTNTFRDRPLLGVNGTGQRKDIEMPLTKISNDGHNNETNRQLQLLYPATPTNKPDKLNGTIELTDDFVDDFDIADNETNIVAEKHNITTFKEDYYQYYNSSIVIDGNRTNQYWDSLKNLTVNSLLSKSHRRAITVQLSFDFPFYGHPVRNITVATGGFLYTGEYVHSWLAATQYIAPLMANFDTSISNDSFVKFSDNGTSFTVLWENVSLQDKQDVGTFTFSVSLHKNGDISFVYYSLPIRIESILDDKHPVKIGLSDAYIIDKTIFFARRKTIYEYHRVNFDSQDINNNTIISLTAQPTCLGLTDCHQCVGELAPSFKCSWCPTINKCSTGTDRKRQDWLQKGCDRTQIMNASQCAPIGTKGNNYGQQQEIEIKDVTNTGDKWIHGADREHPPSKEDSADAHLKTHHFNSHDEGGGVGLAVGLFIPIILVFTLACWVLYAYRNPHTKSGQLLIQYRPSQWSWRRGEARYTAATIHM